MLNWPEATSALTTSSARSDPRIALSPNGAPVVAWLDTSVGVAIGWRGGPRRRGTHSWPLQRRSEPTQQYRARAGRRRAREDLGRLERRHRRAGLVVELLKTPSCRLLTRRFAPRMQRRGIVRLRRRSKVPGKHLHLDVRHHDQDLECLFPTNLGRAGGEIGSAHWVVVEEGLLVELIASRRGSSRIRAELNHWAVAAYPRIAIRSLPAREARGAQRCVNGVWNIGCRQEDAP